MIIVSQNDVFKKRYRIVLNLSNFWILGYLLLRSLGFAEDLPVLNIVMLVIVPASFIGFVIYQYFKLGIAKPFTLTFLLFLLAMLIVVLLELLKVF